MRKGWEIKTLGQVCDIVNGGTPDTNISKFWYGDNLWITPKDMGKLHSVFVDDTLRKITDEGLKNSSAKILPPNSIILSSRAPIGHLAINVKPISTNQGCKGLVPNKEIHFLYLYYFLYKSVDLLNSLGTGATFKELSSSKLSSVEIPIPSISEQLEIVSILDNSFESIKRAKVNAEQNLKNARELFESYLTNIFKNNNDGWVTTTIGEVCNLQTGGTPSTSNKEYYEGGDIKWLVSGDINQKEIFDCLGRITQVGMNNSNTKYLPVNSVLIALNGQGKTRGTVAMLRTKATCNQSLVSIFPKKENELLSELVFANLEGRYEEIRKMTGDSGNDRRGLNMPLIRGIKFSYPKSISIQKEVIGKLDLLRKETNKLESIYKKKLNDLEELKKSILQKAFNGELKTSKISA